MNATVGDARVLRGHRRVLIGKPRQGVDATVDGGSGLIALLRSIDSLPIAEVPSAIREGSSGSELR